MTLQHGNRVRKSSGNQVLRELETGETVETASTSPTENEIRQRAHEIYLGRGGAPGNAQLDWLQAELELRASKAATAQPE